MNYDKEDWTTEMATDMDNSQWGSEVWPKYMIDACTATEPPVAYYVMNIEGMGTIEVDDITQALGDKLEGQLTSFQTHAWMEAIQYVMRAPFKGQQASDIGKAISRLKELL